MRPDTYLAVLVRIYEARGSCGSMFSTDGAASTMR